MADADGGAFLFCLQPRFLSSHCGSRDRDTCSGAPRAGVHGCEGPTGRGTCVSAPAVTVWQHVSFTWDSVVCARSHYATRGAPYLRHFPRAEKQTSQLSSELHGFSWPGTWAFPAWGGWASGRDTGWGGVEAPAWAGPSSLVLVPDPVLLCPGSGLAQVRHWLGLEGRGASRTTRPIAGLWASARQAQPSVVF